MNGNLRPHQINALEAVRDRTVPRGILAMSTGCHVAGQGILMFNGSIKPVEDIEVGDQLMGPDSTARNVLELCRGSDDIVEVQPVKGKPWRVNKSHILALQKTQSDDVIDIAIPDYLAWPKRRQSEWELFRVPIDYARNRPLRFRHRISFRIVDCGYRDQYYGFALDGDQRYLLDDFTVTHNTGKGHIAGHLTEALGTKQVLYLAHRKELIEQLYEHVARVNGAMNVGIEQAGFKSYGQPIVIASVPTLAAMGGRRLERLGSDRFRAAVIDECFPAGTLVDGRPIETIRIGDTVKCYDHIKKLITERRVTARFKRPATELCTVYFQNGPELTCTPDHPIWSRLHQAYMPANTFLGGTVYAPGYDRGGLYVQQVSERFRTHAWVYNLEVAEHNNYFAEGVLVHNCHHSTAASYLQIIASLGLIDGDNRKVDNPPAELIGMTATPSRGDGVALYNVFDEILYSYPLKTAIADGWLVPVRAWSVKTTTDLNGVHTRMGDYAEGELARAVDTDERNAAVLDACTKYAPGQKTLVFCVNVDHADDMARWFCEHGREAKSVSGRTSDVDRAERFDWFQRTPGAVLTNCQLVTEGINIPSVECVVMARPTKSGTLYSQCLGRGTRLADGAHGIDESIALGKSELTLLDITDSSSRIGNRAVRIGDIFGLPLPEKNLDGVLMDEEETFQEKQIEDAQRRKVETIAKQVDLFGQAETPSYCKMGWLPVGNSLHLSLAERCAIKIESDALDREVTSVFDPDKKEWSQIGRIDGKRSLAVAQAEQWVRNHKRESVNFVLRNASWRKDQPSGKQLALCRKLRIDVPDGATKGAVSVALDQHFNRKAK